MFFKLTGAASTDFSSSMISLEETHQSLWENGPVSAIEAKWVNAVILYYLLSEFPERSRFPGNFYKLNHNGFITDLLQFPSKQVYSASLRGVKLKKLKNQVKKEWSLKSIAWMGDM